MEKISFTNATGIFRGQVISHLSGGKCKIFIEAAGWPEEWRFESPNSTDIVDIYGKPLQGYKLPTASQASPIGGGTFGNGVFCYPAIYSYVWCFFENGDENKPIYFATEQRGPDSLIQYEKTVKNKSDPKDNSYTISFGGSKIEICNEYIKLTHTGASSIIKSQNGSGDKPGNTFGTNFTVQVSEDGIILQNEENRSSIRMNSNGYISLSVNGKTTPNIEISYPKVTIDGNIIAINAETFAILRANKKRDGITVIGNSDAGYTWVNNGYIRPMKTPNENE